MFALKHQPLLFAHIVCLCPNPIFLPSYLLLPPIIFPFSTIYLSLFFTRNHNHLLLLHLTTFYIQFKELESTTMTGMEPIRTEVAESRLSVANIVHDVFWAMFLPKLSSRLQCGVPWISGSRGQSMGAQACRAEACVPCPWRIGG